MPRQRRYLTSDLVTAYVAAKREVVDAGYVDEIAWQGRVRLRDVNPTNFTREAAWVSLSAGMSAEVVHTRFPALEAALHRWVPHEIAADPKAAE